ncbi:MAG: hypothetical protein Q9213_003050 [Squamulea squamosa]
MPQLRDVTVHVTDVDGNNLEEWGIQNLRGNKISAYIKSTTDMPFRVSVQPKIPYFEDDSPHDRIQSPWTDEPDDICIKMEDAGHKLPGEPSSSRRSFERRSSRPRTNHRVYPRRRYTSRHSSSSILPFRKGAHEDISPPFTLLATLYLDGRRKPERKIVVYLDPNDEDFNQPAGLVKFKCRTVQGCDGFLREHAWVFKDIGIETIFDKVALGENARDTSELEDVLVEGMNRSKINDGPVLTNEESGKIGQIVVELERVVLGRKYKERNFRPKHNEGDRDDVDMEGVGSDVVHTTGLEHLRSLDHRPVRCVEFEPYAREQLQRFGFPGYPKDIQQRSFRERQLLNTTLANLTPLSISQSKGKAPAPRKHVGPSFEKRVKEGLHDSTNIPPPEYEFQDYRDRLEDVPDELPQAASNMEERLAATHPILGADKPTDFLPDQRTSSAVVAVKKRTRRPSRGKFALGARKSSSSSVSSLSLSKHPPSPPIGSPVHQPANSPTTGFYNPVADPRLSTHRGTEFDIFKTISSASLALTKAKSSKADGELTPKSVKSNSKIFRGEPHSSSDADADDEQDGQSEEASSVSADDDNKDSEQSDKENEPSADNDDAGLHEEFKMVTLGTKRQRGEGMEDLEDGEIAENDESSTGMDLGKKRTSPTHVPKLRLSLPTPEKKAVGEEREQQSKRLKYVSNETVEPEKEREAREAMVQGQERGHEVEVELTMEGTTDVLI